MKAFIVAAGTGGHLFPGVAIAQQLKQKGWQVSFIVRRGDMGKSLLSRDGFLVHELPGQGFPRTLSLQLLRFPWQLIKGFIGAYHLLRSERPRVLIGMGGYLSFPVLLVGRLLSIRTVIHEQNVYPGLSNRLLARWVDAVAISFEEARRYFSAKTIWLTGLPVRQGIGSVSREDSYQRLKLDPGLKTILIFGGSLGAKRLNEVIIQLWKRSPAWLLDFQVLHITGEKNLAAVQKSYEGLSVKAEVIPFCHDMPAAYAAADVIVSRSGASTIAELSIMGKPALLIPYPYASEDHQAYNAQVLVKTGQATMIREEALTADRLDEAIQQILSHQKRSDSRLTQDSPHANAAQQVVSKLESLLA